MKSIPLERLTKKELIVLINRNDCFGRIKDDATAVYYNSRSEKIKEKMDAISRRIDENLKEQKPVIQHFNSCKDLDRKIRLATRLKQLTGEFARLNNEFVKYCKESDGIFSECYGAKK